MNDKLTKDMVTRISELERQSKGVSVSRARIQAQHWAQAVSATLALPGLIGCWAAGINASGDWIDSSGNANHLTMGGGPQYWSYNPYWCGWRYYGSADWHYHADAADFDITGAETINRTNTRGLTMYCWASFVDAPSVTENLVAKWESTPNRSYRLIRKSTGELQFEIGDTVQEVDSVALMDTLGVGTWYHCAGRFDPGAEIACFLNGVKSVKVNDINATIDNSEVTFTTGAKHGGNLEMNGELSLVALCNCYHPDEIVIAHYQMTRAAFGRY